MYNIKRHWNIIFLHLLAHIIKGVTYTKADIGTVRNGCIPIVRANNIQGDKLDYKDLVWVVESRIAPDQFLRQGDVVVATSSGSKHLVGKTASFDGKQKISCGAFCAILRPNNLVDNLFFKYFFQTQEYRNLISSYAKGSNINNLKNGDLAKIQIPVPPMAEQKRIVRKIEELFGVIDRDIQRLTDTLEQLSQFRQSVLEKLLNSHIPNSTLGELLQPRRERIIPSLKNQEMPYVGLDSIEPGALTLSKIETLQQTKSSCFLFCKDDVLYGRMRSYLNKVFKADFKGAASAEFIVFPKSEKILPDYLKYLLHQHRFVVFATKNSSGDRPRVKFEEDLAPFHFYLPALPEQQKIVDEIEKAFRSADKVQKAVQNALEEAKKLKQSILKKTFAGELIPQDPNDKPVNLPVLKGQTK